MIGFLFVCAAFAVFVIAGAVRVARRPKDCPAVDRDALPCVGLYRHDGGHRSVNGAFGVTGEGK
jgi:hypothetical protein